MHSRAERLLQVLIIWGTLAALLAVIAALAPAPRLLYALILYPVRRVEFKRKTVLTEAPFILYAFDYRFIRNSLADHSCLLRGVGKNN